MGHIWDGTGLDRSEHVCVGWGGTHCREDWVLERLIIVFFFTSVAPSRFTLQLCHTLYRGNGLY